MAGYRADVLESDRGYVVILAVTTPLPPTLNHTYMPVPRGSRCGMIMTEEARAYKEAVTLLVNATLVEHNVEANSRWRYEMAIDQFLERNNRDVDSNVKLVMDAVFDGLGVNDNRVFFMTLGKEVGGVMLDDDPRLEITVRKGGARL